MLALLLSGALGLQSWKDSDELHLEEGRACQLNKSVLLIKLYNGNNEKLRALNERMCCFQIRRMPPQLRS